MRTLPLLTLAAALAAAPACGSKSKPAGKPVTSTDGSGDRKNDKPRLARNGNGTGTGDAAGDAASLGEVIYFEFDDFKLSDEAKATLESNAKWLKDDPARTLLIEGHTDEVGTSEYNIGLGERRAKAARDYLLSLGVEDKRLRILSYGEERPAGADDAHNRRSGFVATKK
jgi:peptidoglycan-associated lipoprotein